MFQVLAALLYHGAMGRIYLDHHATTPVDPAVLDAMLPYFTQKFGNAASRTHAFGWEAHDAVERARNQVARAIGATPQEIIWTSGATEAINLALAGVVAPYQQRERHVITTAIEHPATLDACAQLAREGCRVTMLPVDRHGLLSPVALADAITPDTILASVIHGNNEIGTLQPLAELAAVARARGVLFHVDAAQSFGKVPLDVDALGIDLLSASAHKVYGPKGIGLLYVRRRKPRIRLMPQIHGGGHEGGLRAGTLNVPAIVGFGMAAELAIATLSEENARITALRDRLQQTILSGVAHVSVNGHPVARLAGNLSLSVAFVSGEALVSGLGGIAVSTGSACASGSLAPSHVLAACGVSPELARGTLRFGIGRFTSAAEIAEAAARTIDTILRLRAASPLYQLWCDGAIDPGMG